MPVSEQVDPLPSTIMHLPTSTSIDVGPMMASADNMDARTPPSVPEPSTTAEVPPMESIPSTPPPSPGPLSPSNGLPNVGEVALIPSPVRTHRGLSPSTMDVHRKELGAQPSTSVVDVIPTDPSSPEAAKLVPSSVKRYLQRWPVGDRTGDPQFGYTSLHEYRPPDNKEDDDMRRASLLSNVPSHVNVSLHHARVVSGGHNPQIM